jgi:hypothetical protein
MPQPLSFPAVVPESIRRLILLFQKRSEELRFPGVDFARLWEGVGQIQSELGELERAQAALSKVQEEITRRQKELILLSRQAHAYATIFAQNDEELLSELMTIAVGEGERANRKQRGRSAASESSGTEPITSEPPSVELKAQVEPAAASTSVELKPDAARPTAKPVTEELEDDAAE